VALAGHTSRRSKTLEAAVDGPTALDLSRAFSPERTGAQAYVRVTRGCNKFCSFCVVPYTRGPEVHRDPDGIVDEVRRLAAAGALEVTLIGQTVNHYQHNDTSFAQLLARVHDEVPELPRLRFVTSYPRDFTDEALDVMASRARIAPYLHIPAQSGSDRLLRSMNRGYTSAEYYGLIDRARARMPDIRLAGDMIVGFPGETDEDHQASLELLERVRYKQVFVFKYSPREGTVAARRLVDDVPEEVKKQRNHQLLELQGKIALEANRAQIGSTVDVLVESEGKRRDTPPADGIVLGWQKKSGARLVGRTGGDEIVAFNGPVELIGKFAQVRVIEATPLTLLGELSAAATH
jgi:tRNA-2-methylthio-N6-dimethylallyladenosine synthase